jgi:hypothetical protein
MWVYLNVLIVKTIQVSRKGKILNGKIYLNADTILLFECILFCVEISVSNAYRWSTPQWGICKYTNLLLLLFVWSEISFCKCACYYVNHKVLYVFVCICRALIGAFKSTRSFANIAYNCGQSIVLSTRIPVLCCSYSYVLILNGTVTVPLFWLIHDFGSPIAKSTILVPLFSKCWTFCPLIHFELNLDDVAIESIKLFILSHRLD